MILRVTSKFRKKQKRGPKIGEHSYLSFEQQQAIQKLLIDKTPDQLRFNFALWTSQSVALAIKEQFNITLGDRSVRRYLASWGYTPQRPIRRAYEQNNEAVKNWMDTEYPAIKERAKKKKQKSIGAMKLAQKPVNTGQEDMHQKARRQNSGPLKI